MGLLKKIAGLMGSKSRALALSVSVAFGALFGFGTQAYAALPANITGVFDTANENAVAIGWVVLGLIAAIMAFKFIRRAL